MQKYMKDYYKALGVSRDTSQEEIKKAFRRMALRYHPDRNPQDQKQAEEKFKAINEAYQVLGDEGKRQQYDYITALSQYMQSSVIADNVSVDASAQGLDEETIRRFLGQLVAQACGFKRCGRGYWRRCQRW